MPSYSDYSPLWFAANRVECAQWPGRRHRASCSAFDPIAGQLALHPGSARTTPSTIIQSTMSHAFTFILANIGFTPRTSIFSVNACGRLWVRVSRRCGGLSCGIATLWIARCGRAAVACLGSELTLRLIHIELGLCGARLIPHNRRTTCKEDERR
jgi:hypothetical protein